MPWRPLSPDQYGSTLVSWKVVSTVVVLRLSLGCHALILVMEYGTRAKLG